MNLIVVSITISINIGRAPLALDIIKLGIICDRLSLSQLLEPIGVDGREMNENIIFALGIGCDESESFLAEELDGPGYALLGFGHLKAGDLSGDGSTGEGLGANDGSGEEGGSEFHGE